MAWLDSIQTALMFAGLVFTGAWLTPLRKPMKWLWKRNVSEPLGDWFRSLVRKEVEQTEHLVTFHLGPNHDSKPLHERIEALEDFVTFDPQDQI